MPSTPLRQQTLERLRGAITSGRFRPGSRLIERELCDYLGVSRTLVRETLRQLETEGLVIIAPHRGPIVTALNLDEVESIYQARAVLEGLAAQLFAERASEADRAALRESWERLVVAYGAHDKHQVSAAKTDFYEILLQGSQNTVIPGLLRQLHARVTQLRFTSMSLPGRSEQSLTEIRRIIEAIERRDGPTAYAMTVEHIDRAAAAARIVLEAAFQFAPGASRPQERAVGT